jgi:hypothetical protein
MDVSAPDLPSVIRTLEDELTLPPGFIAALYQEDDWSFVIKSHALVEALLTYLLSAHLENSDVGSIFAFLDTSNPRTGKLAFAKAFGLLNQDARRFVRGLSELRNKLVHDVANVRFTFGEHVAQLNKQTRREWVQAFGFGLLAVGETRLGKLEPKARQHLDALVTDEPKMAIMASVAWLALTIFSHGQNVDMRRAMDRLADILNDEYERKQSAKQNATEQAQ